jgi:hypothetical protein
MSLFVEQSFWIFLILTVIMGGGAAFMAGRSLASGWKPVGLLLAYMIPATAGVRFLHFALFEAQLFSLQYFLAHGLVLVGFALLGYRISVALRKVRYAGLEEQDLNPIAKVKRCFFLSNPVPLRNYAPKGQ